MRKIIINIKPDGRAEMDIRGLNFWQCVKVLSSCITGLARKMAHEQGVETGSKIIRV